MSVICTDCGEPLPRECWCGGGAEVCPPGAGAYLVGDTLYFDRAQALEAIAKLEATANRGRPRKAAPITSSRRRIITRADLDAAWAAYRRANGAGAEIPGYVLGDLNTLEQEFANQQRLAAAAAARIAARKLGSRDPER